MRIPRIFQPQALSLKQPIDLDQNGTRHIGTVLRKQPNDPICVFNGKGGEYQGTIKAVNKKAVTVYLDTFIPNDNESPLSVHLGQVVSRGERMDYALQKAVEMGVTEITPLFSRRCEVKLTGPRLEKRMQQWQHLLISACEQSGRNRIPTLHKATQAALWWEDCQLQGDDLGWLLHPGTAPLDSVLKGERPRKVYIAVGPEGGFEPEECQAATSAGFVASAIGPRILRTETAPITALALLNRQWGDY